MIILFKIAWNFSAVVASLLGNTDFKENPLDVSLNFLEI